MIYNGTKRELFDYIIMHPFWIIVTNRGLRFRTQKQNKWNCSLQHNNKTFPFSILHLLELQTSWYYCVFYYGRLARAWVFWGIVLIIPCFVELDLFVCYKLDFISRENCTHTISCGRPGRRLYTADKVEAMLLPLVSATIANNSRCTSSSL